ncbi:Elongation factor 1 gamma [Aphelenchoides besseyi]|nr:Elongation factor 1 gamma [Aphelenchoides besseyi]
MTEFVTGLCYVFFCLPFFAFLLPIISGVVSSITSVYALMIQYPNRCELTLQFLSVFFASCLFLTTTTEAFCLRRIHYGNGTSVCAGILNRTLTSTTACHEALTDFQNNILTKLGITNVHSLEISLTTVLAVCSLIHLSSGIILSLFSARENRFTSPTEKAPGVYRYCTVPRNLYTMCHRTLEFSSPYIWWSPEQTNKMPQIACLVVYSYQLTLNKMVNTVVYGDAQSFRTQKILIAAKFAGKKVETKSSAPPAEKFPLGLTPALEEGETTLFGADAIVKHLVQKDSTYVPNEPSLDQWLSWADSELLPNVLAYVLPSLSFAHLDHDTVEHAKKELLAQLQRFDKHLLTRTFLVGERLSMADVSVALNLVAAFKNVLDTKTRKNLVNLTRWFTTVVNQPKVKEVVGEVKLADEVATFHIDAFKKNSATHKKDDKKHDNKKKDHHETKSEKKEKPQKAPKEHQPKEPEDDDGIPQEPKFVDPFLEFPGGEFNMDAFKRVYSNEDTNTKAIPWFWAKFEPENYSIWYGEYKYPEELTQVFMSCNLITGMFQRLDKMRKHAFGSVCLFGDNNDSTISGIWIWRGPKLAFELSPDWQVDYESYNWTKLDPNSEDTKKKVNAYLAWEGFDNPKPFNQGKIFK